MSPCHGEVTVASPPHTSPPTRATDCVLIAPREVRCRSTNQVGLRGDDRCHGDFVMVPSGVVTDSCETPAEGVIQLPFEASGIYAGATIACAYGGEGVACWGGADSVVAAETVAGPLTWLARDPCTGVYSCGLW